MLDGPTWRRRLAMPLVALLIAAALMTWNSWRATGQDRQVQQFAAELVADVQSGRDPAPRLAGGDSLIVSRLMPPLAEVVRRAGGRADRLRVVVHAGDAQDAGSAGGQATHTAVILIDGQEALGLRLVHQGEGRPIAIIGFWTTPP